MIEVRVRLVYFSARINVIKDLEVRYFENYLPDL